MKKLLLVLSIVSVLALTGCTEQQRARNFGGSYTENLPSNQKLVTMTWKQDHLWILTRPMRTNEVAETYSFKESSSWGIIQGNVTVVESK